MDLEHELLEGHADHLRGLEGAEDAAGDGGGGGGGGRRGRGGVVVAAFSVAAIAPSTPFASASTSVSSKAPPRIERKAHPRPRPPSPPLPLQRRGPGHKVLDEQAHPARRVVPPLLELARVDHEADVVDRDRGLGDVGGDDALADAAGRALEGPALVCGRDGRVQGQDPAFAPPGGLGRGEPGADRGDLRRAGQEDEHGASGADGCLFVVIGRRRKRKRSRLGNSRLSFSSSFFLEIVRRVDVVDELLDQVVVDRRLVDPRQVGPHERLAVPVELRIEPLVEGPGRLERVGVGVAPVLAGEPGLRRRDARRELLLPPAGGLGVEAQGGARVRGEAVARAGVGVFQVEVLAGKGAAAGAQAGGFGAEVGGEEARVERRRHQNDLERQRGEERVLAVVAVVPLPFQRLLVGSAPPRDDVPQDREQEIALEAPLVDLVDDDVADPR